MSYSEDMIALVDQRIALANKRDKAAGTVINRDTTGPGALVLFDGATTPMPVKCVGNVFCRESDRVVLDRYGSDWCITGAFVGPGFGEAFRRITYATGTVAATSTSYIDVTDFGTMVFNKIFDGTFVRIGQLWSGYANAVTTGCEFAVRFTATEGGEGFTPVDYSTGRCFMNASGDHQISYGSTRATGIPAGTYTVSYRLRRYTGAGNVVSDSNDQVFIELDERVRSNTPIL